MRQLRRPAAVGFFAAATVATAGQLAGQVTSESVREAAAAIPADSVAEVRLAAGSRLYGYLEDTGDPIRLRLLEGGTIEVSYSRVASISAASGVVRGGRFWREERTHLNNLIGPTGNTLPAGVWTLAAYEIFLPVAYYGVSDALTIGFGTPLIWSFLAGYDATRLSYGAVKARIYKKERISVAVGSMLALDPGTDVLFLGPDADDRPPPAGADGPHLEGVGYAALTWAGDGGSFTAAAGLGPVDKWEWGSALAMLSGSYRTGRTIKLVGEVYFVPGNNGTPILSVAVRMFGERLSVDFGAMTLNRQTLPLLNFSYVF